MSSWRNLGRRRHSIRIADGRAIAIAKAQSRELRAQISNASDFAETARGHPSFCGIGNERHG
eukprot:959464-Alexandrium_andersonii.AAC.1